MPCAHTVPADGGCPAPSAAAPITVPRPASALAPHRLVLAQHAALVCHADRGARVVARHHHRADVGVLQVVPGVANISDCTWCMHHTLPMQLQPQGLIQQVCSCAPAAAAAAQVKRAALRTCSCAMMAVVSLRSGLTITARPQKSRPASSSSCGLGGQAAGSRVREPSGLTLASKAS